MAFHGNINIPFEALEAGEMAKDIIRKRGDRWVFEDKSVRLKSGDVIYYWIYVILDGLGYQGLDRSHTVTGKYINVSLCIRYFFFIMVAKEIFWEKDFNLGPSRNLKI